MNSKSVKVVVTRDKYKNKHYKCAECDVEVEWMKPTCPCCHKHLRWGDFAHYDTKGIWHDEVQQQEN